MGNIEEITLLQEIQEEVREIRQVSGFDAEVRALNTLSQNLAQELNNIAKEAKKENLIKEKRLLQVHLKQALMYQEVYVDKDGKIVSYGDVYMQGLSQNNTGSGRTHLGSFTRVALPSDIEFVEVFGGHTTFYALPKEGNFLYVWGANVEGCAGAGHTQVIPMPVRVEMPARVVKICCGTSEVDSKQSAVALLENGLVYVSGSNSIGELGTGNTLPLSTFTQNPYLSNIEDISFASNGYAGIMQCIDSEGALWVCGHNTQGACGNGNNTHITIPFKISFNQKVKYARASINRYSNVDYSTCLLIFEDGSVRGAGYGGDNNLSQAATGNSNIFISLTNNQGEILSHIIKVFPASIYGTACALDESGTLYVWGKGSYGYGNDIGGNNLIAQKVLENVESLVHWDRANTRIIVKLKSSDSFLGFGFNTDGSLGIGTNANSNIFTPVYVPSNVSEFAFIGFGAGGHLVMIAKNKLYACGTASNGSIKYTTPTLQKQ